MSEEHTLQEVLADYLRDRGNSTLLIDKFYDIAPPPSGGVDGKTVSNPRLREHGRPPKDYVPRISESPKSGKALVVIALEQHKVRFPTRDFTQWLEHRELAAYGMIDKMEAELGARRVRTVLGLRTSYAGPRIWAMEVDLNEVGSWNPGDSRDSSPSTEPEG
jgi:hypothetical protein